VSTTFIIQWQESSLVLIVLLCVIVTVEEERSHELLLFLPQVIGFTSWSAGNDILTGDGIKFNTELQT
jgi:hypothetical protein